MTPPRPTTSGDYRILYATELWFPPTGFSAPHRLAIAQSEDGPRCLVIVDGALPSPGTSGMVRVDPEGRRHWRALSGPLRQEVP